MGGKKLDAFELVTAINAASKFDLREDWNGDGIANPRWMRSPPGSTAHELHVLDLVGPPRARAMM